MSGRRGCDCRSEQDPTLCQGGMLLDLAECKIILRVNDRQLAPKWFSLHFFFFFYFGVLLFRNVLEETGSKTEVDSWSGAIYLYNESVSLLEININK